MSSATLAKALAPPIVLDLFRRWSGRTLRFAGAPASWQEAVRVSAGYGAPDILSRVVEATRAVVAGTAPFERDSILFDEPEYPFAVLAALCRAAGATGRLTVVDFGGSLGSSYRQCRAFLDRLTTIRWQVVEQPAFVDAGRREFTTDELSFHGSVDDLPPAVDPTLVLASSALQYLEDPYAHLAAFTRSAAAHLVIDRTPMLDGTTDRLCIQHVPRHIYPASYPCRLLSRASLIEHLQADWRLLCDFGCAEGRRATDDGLSFEYRGLILERRS
ncbi:MAG: methyltransferase, TIGR04325 family [Caldimonas sp.]